MLRLHYKRPFTHDKLVETLTTWKHPDEVEDFVNEIWTTLPNLGLMRTVLEVAWQHQIDDETNLPSPGMILGDPKVRALKLPLQKLYAILETLVTTTGMVVIHDEQSYAFELRAQPEVILQALAATVDVTSAEPRSVGKKGDPPKA